MMVFIFISIIITTLIITTLVFAVKNKNDLTYIRDNTGETTDGVDWLFSIASDDALNVTTTTNPTNPRLVTIVLSSKESSFHMFSNIPKHVSFDAGNLLMAESMWNGYKDNKIDVSKATSKQAESVNALVNTRDSPFIDEQPNATFSFTQTGNTVTHIETIGKILAITNDGTDTSITFEVHVHEKLVPKGTYEHVSITVDDFWDTLGAVASIAGAGLTCSVVEVGSAGTATALCGRAIVGACSAFGKAV